MYSTKRGMDGCKQPDPKTYSGFHVNIGHFIMIHDCLLNLIIALPCPALPSTLGSLGIPVADRRTCVAKKGTKEKRTPIAGSSKPHVHIMYMGGLKT